MVQPSLSRLSSSQHHYEQALRAQIQRLTGTTPAFHELALGAVGGHYLDGSRTLADITFDGQGTQDDLTVYVHSQESGRLKMQDITDLKERYKKGTQRTLAVTVIDLNSPQRRY